jgi:hypothetical protein
MPLRPPECSVRRLELGSADPSSSSPGINYSPEVLPPQRTADIGSRSHCAVSHSLGFVVFRNGDGVNLIPPNFYEFRLPPESSRSELSWLLAGPTPLMGFCSLQHLSGPRVHISGSMPSAFVPPSGFEYPLGGFLPSNPSGYDPTALLGFSPSKPCLSARFHDITAIKNPPAVSACR